MAGTWTVGSGSVVGYRVNEVLLGQNATAVGRTTSVTGHLTISGSAATAASFSVPMDTIHSDKSQRDAQFDGRIMDVAQYPTGTFALTSPIELGSLPASGVIKSYTAHGKLTLHGTTRVVTFTLTAEGGKRGAQIEVAGDIPVLFSDYNIQNPSFAGFVTTQDHGLLEFLLIFTRAELGDLVPHDDLAGVHPLHRDHPGLLRIRNERRSALGGVHRDTRVMCHWVS